MTLVPSHRPHRVDAYLSRKAAEVWGPQAVVWVVPMREPTDPDYQQVYELHRQDKAPVVLGWKFAQARGGLQVLMRAARAREREAEEEKRREGRGEETA